MNTQTLPALGPERSKLFKYLSYLRCTTRLLLLSKSRRIYAVNRGRYIGEWWVQVPQNQTSKVGTIVFFSLPDRFIREISQKDLQEGLSKNILEPVDVLPKSVYNICIAEYHQKLTDEQRNHAFNRWEQHDTPDSLDSE